VDATIKKPDALLHHQWPCTACGGDATIGYGASKKHGDWGGRIRIGERLCTACFQKRGGTNIFGRK
jgi:hypothetical protein